MLDRLIPIEVFRGHWKGLSDYRTTPTKPDVVARIFVTVVPLGAFIAMMFTHGSISAPAGLLSGMALLAGGLLSAFGQLSSLRLKLTDRADDFALSEQGNRDFLDETAAHLLVAAYMAGVTAILLVLGMNFSTDHEGAIVGFLAALAALTGAHVAAVFLLALPRLYVAYTTINGVRLELSGTHSNKSFRRR
ncbi:hypothetical protein ACX80U_12275 [Arthrobacter sp. TmT3-37]